MHTKGNGCELTINLHSNTGLSVCKLSTGNEKETGRHALPQKRDHTALTDFFTIGVGSGNYIYKYTCG